MGIENVDWGTKLGEGTFGAVYPTLDGKYVFKKCTSEEGDCFEAGLTEISVTNSLKGHPNIIKIKGIYSDDDIDGYFMKRYPYSLEDIYRDKMKLSRVKSIFYKIAIGIHHAHSKFIAHADIKPANILIDKNDNIAIADWGSAILFKYNQEIGKSTQIQTLLYRAPEVLLGDYWFTEKIDIWSLGILLIQLITGKRFITSSSEEGQLKKIVKIFGSINEDNWMGVTKLGNYELIRDINGGQDRLVFDKITKDEVLLDLLNNMLMLNPEDRFDITQVINHEFFNDLRKGEFLPTDNIENISLIKQLNFNEYSPVMIKYINTFNINYYSTPNTCILSILYYNYVKSIYNIAEKYNKLCAVSCIYLAQKFSEQGGASLDDLESYSGFSKDLILKSSKKTFEWLEYDLYVATPDLYLTFIKKICGYRKEQQIIKLTSNLIFESVEERDFYSYSYHELALSSFYIITPYRIAKKLTDNNIKNCVKFLMGCKLNKIQ